MSKLLSDPARSWTLRWPRLRPLLAAATYWLLGAAGIGFAVAPSYASPIFPAAGFAVAYLLWAGAGQWPAIWVGSLALNTGVALLHGEVGVRTVAAAFGIATATTGQALLARALVLRGVGGGWRDLEEERKIVRCLILAGPVACLMAASLALPLMVWARLVPGGDYGNFWWNWWSGDVLGVLIMLPLSLAVLQRHETAWMGRLRTLVPPMLVALSVVGGAFFVAAKYERSEDVQAVRRHGDALAKLLSQRFTAHQEALAALHRLLEVSPDMDQSKFSYFTNVTLQDNPDLLALSINPLVKGSERASFEREMALSASTPGFEIWERGSQGQRLRADPRAVYVPVALIAPLDGNRPAIGYDIHSDSVRHDAIVRAMRSDSAVLTAPLHLVQESRKSVGALLLHPVHSPSVVRHFGADGLRGFVVAVVKVDRMVDIAIRGAVVPNLVLRIEDVSAGVDMAQLYDSQPDAKMPSDDYLWQQDVMMADRTWRLSVFPKPEFLGNRSHSTMVLVGVGGLALASLLQVLLLVTTGNTAVVQRKVREQTAQLQIASASMADQNAQLNALFTLSPDGFVAFSMAGSVRFANPAFFEMTGISRSVVLGRGSAVLDEAIRERCASPAAFAGVAAYFQSAGAPLLQQPLELKSPAPKVLQLVGVHSKASSVARILYLRDVTHETEVENLKSEFLSTAAHELRTPMASIYGFAEVLMNQDLDARSRKEMLDIIYRQSGLMASILNELLDLARIEARRGKDFVLQLMDVRELVDCVVREFRPPVDRQPPLVGATEQALFIVGDDKKARQAIVNLLSNAYKYSPAGGSVRIDLMSRKPVGARAQVGICVVDQGIGMTPEQLARVFERFYRADASGKIPGTGLGMSIVHEIISLHGGTVELSSEPGVGTSVTLWLPAAPPPLALRAGQSDPAGGCRDPIPNGQLS